MSALFLFENLEVRDASAFEDDQRRVPSTLACPSLLVELQAIAVRS